MIIQIVPISELKFADYNPRKLTDKQVDDLKKSIETFGLVEPIVVNSHPERKNVIIGGHQRVRIAEMVGKKDVPVVYVNLDEKKERELNIRLNRNVGEWDWDKLANEFDMQGLKDWGFNEVDFGIMDEKKSENKYVYDCPHCSKKIASSNRVARLDKAD